MAYKEYFKFNKDNIIDYIRKETDLFSDKSVINIEEIGDGNINYIYRIYDSNKSIIIKQGDRLLRKSQRPLDMNRTRIEADILNIYYKLTDGMVPKLYRYDNIMNCIIMEDISEYRNLKLGLLDRDIYSDLAKNLSDFIIDISLANTDIVKDSKEKNNIFKNFINTDLCDITETLVFTEPYKNNRDRNSISEENKDFIIKELYMDKELILDIGILKNYYKNNKQSLIHGDLHTGSIFVKDNSIKIIDPEFGFYGPIAYDIGNIIGHLIISLFSIKYSDNDLKREESIEFIIDTIKDFVNNTLIGLDKRYRESVQDIIAKDDLFRKWYIKEIMEYSSGYAGTEIIRRVVGSTKTIDIESIKNTKKRAEMERKLIIIGKRLIKDREKILYGNIYRDIIIDII